MNKQNKQRLNELHLKEMTAKFPSVPVNCIPSYNCKETGANDLTRLIKDFINLSGYQAERISTTGRMIDNTKISTDVLGNSRTIGSMKYIPGTSTKGSADISATIKGRSVKIEVKWDKDKQSDAQKEYANSVERAGGIYYIARTFDDFIVFFDNFINSL